MELKEKEIIVDLSKIGDSVYEKFSKVSHTMTSKEIDYVMYGVNMIYDIFREMEAEQHGGD